MLPTRSIITADKENLKVKTKQELDKLKQECEDLSTKLQGLTDTELEEVTGGDFWDVLKKVGEGMKSVVQPVVSTGPAPSVNSPCNCAAEKK